MPAIKHSLNKREHPPEDKESGQTKRPSQESRATSPQTDYGSLASEELAQLVQFERDIAPQSAAASGNSLTSGAQDATPLSQKQNLPSGNGRAASETDYGSLPSSELESLDDRVDPPCTAPTSPAQEEPPATTGKRLTDEPRPTPKPFALTRPPDKTYNRKMPAIKKRGHLSEDEEPARTKRQRLESRATSPEADYGSLASEELAQLVQFERDIARKSSAASNNTRASAPQNATPDLPQRNLPSGNGRDASETDCGSLPSSDLESLDDRIDPPCTAPTSPAQEEPPATTSKRPPPRLADERDPAPKPFTLTLLRDKTYNRNLLEKIGQPWHLAYPPRWAPHVPLLAASHQIRDLLRDGRAALPKDHKDLWTPGRPPKSKLFVIAGYEGGKGLYRELDAAHVGTLSFEEKRHLGVLPDWKMTDKEMFELGLLTRDQVVLTPSPSIQSSQSGSRYLEKRLVQAKSPGSFTERMAVSASESNHSDSNPDWDSDADIPVKIHFVLVELKRGQLGPNFEGWTPASIRHHWLPMLPKPEGAFEKKEKAEQTRDVDAAELRGLDARRDDRRTQGRD
ncbi:hypothetical protein [Rhizobium sp. NLR22b]|uniref:hypothetical protein n=1 Tax=Rhizobium sp. NLR22b TaxID=2731115 RepID=UPI001C83041C|nr:hypothetical protein [Rhizobium sp. NLR22b]MBX5242038.1 hypothetical protein [Rhizobium sp. NLR22b]